MGERCCPRCDTMFLLDTRDPETGEYICELCGGLTSWQLENLELKAEIKRLQDEIDCLPIEQLAKAEAKIEQLQAIVAKLPKWAERLKRLSMDLFHGVGISTPTLTRLAKEMIEAAEAAKGKGDESKNT